MRQPASPLWECFYSDFTIVRGWFGEKGSNEAMRDEEEAEGWDHWL